MEEQQGGGSQIQAVTGKVSARVSTAQAGLSSYIMAPRCTLRCWKVCHRAIDDWSLTKAGFGQFQGGSSLPLYRKVPGTGNGDSLPPRN